MKYDENFIYFFQFSNFETFELPMVYRPPYPWNIDPLPMYIDPPTYGILTPPTHGISTPLPMVFDPPIHGILTPYPWYIDPLPMVY